VSRDWTVDLNNSEISVDWSDTYFFYRLDERLELDYQIGEDLKDRIIPHSILYFTGEATAYEMDDEDFDDEFDDEEVSQMTEE